MGDVFVKPGGGGADLDVVTATPGDVLAGKVIVGAAGEPAAGTMPERGAWSGSVAMNGSIAIPGGHHNGGGQINGPSITDRGAWGTALGINGSVAIPEGYHNGGGRITQSIPTFGGQTISPSAGQQVAYCAGKYATGNVTVGGVSNLSPANIKKGVTVGGVTGTFEGYVPTATDLYLRGNNIASWSKISGGTENKVTFESGQIYMTNDMAATSGHEQEARTIIVTENQVNLTGYNYINIEFYAYIYFSPSLAVVLSLTKGGVIDPKNAFASTARNSTGTGILSLNITDINAYRYVRIHEGGSYFHIYRIWLS